MKPRRKLILMNSMTEHLNNRSMNLQLRPSPTIEQYVHKQQQLTCRNCNMKFCFTSSLQVHLISHCKKKLHKCCEVGCNKEYKYKQDFLQHIKCHEHMSFKCDQCEYSSSEKRLLRRHMVPYSDKKLYRCIKCGKKYKQYNSLNRHAKKCPK